ncbi:hypothetical protein PAMA_008717 [Pampus argenteus]
MWKKSCRSHRCNYDLPHFNDTKQLTLATLLSVYHPHPVPTPISPPPIPSRDIQFRTASETQAAITIPVPAVSHEGPHQRPTGVPSARAPGPVSHIPTLGPWPVHQDWSDGKMEAGRESMVGYGSVPLKWP